MAKPTLPTNYLDDIMNAGMGGKRRYRIINNSDDTISLEDATKYDQVGSNFGAGQLNAIGSAVNQCVDKATIIEDMSDIAANTQTGKIAGALAVKDLNQRFGGLEFNVQDGKGQYRAVGADTWLPFKRLRLIRSGLSSQYDQTVDVSAVDNNYQKYTSSDFLLTFDAIAYGAITNEADYGGAVSFSYNPETGMMSIPRRKYFFWSRQESWVIYSVYLV